MREMILLISFLSFSTYCFGKKLYKAKDYKENNELVNIIKSGIIDLKDEIKKNV